jgi:hypothetical protein
MSDNTKETSNALEDSGTSDEPVSDNTTPDPEVAGEGETGADDPDTENEADDRQGREAAKFRRRLRAVEAERDQLAQQVQALQRQEIERQAAAAQLQPAALWTAAELADLLTDSGTVDGERVDAAITAARQLLGVPPPKGNHVPMEGRNVSAAPARTTVDDMVNAVMGH